MFANKFHYSRLFRSPHFTFLVGDEKAHLTIHSAAVENLSAPMYALINNGSMKETQTKTATLEDVEANNFIGFCEVVYTGQYVTPTGKTDGNVQQEPRMEEQPDEIPADWSKLSGLQRRRYEKMIRNRSSLYGNSDNGWQSPKKEKKDDDQFFNDLWEKFTSRQFDGGLAKLSSGPEILFHAKSYIFATPMA